MTMTTLAGTTVAFLATYLLHSTLLQGAAWALGRAVVRTEAWRELLWKAALVGGVATAMVAQVSPWTPVRLTWPAVGAASPAVSAVGTAPRRAEVDVRGAELAAVSGEAGAASQPVLSGVPEGASETRTNLDRAAPASGSATPSTTSRRVGLPISWPAALVVAWAAVAVLLLARLTWRHVRLARRLSGRRPVTDARVAGALAELRRSAGVWTPVHLTTSDAVSSPLLLGRREICVPERFLSDLGPAEQRAALAHELGHVARRDPAWQLGALILECVFFFQPLHRVVRRGLRECAEYLADSWAVRLSGERLGLARCLSEVAAWVAPAGEPPVAHTVAMAEGGSPLLARVSRLLEREPEIEPRAAARVAAGVALILAAAAAAPAVRADAGADEAGEGAGIEAAIEGARESADDGSPEPLEAAWPDESAEEPQAAPVVIRAPLDGGLEARIAWARAQAGDAPRYWIAWAVPSVLPATTHVTMDSEEGMTMHVTDTRDPMLRFMSGGGRAAAVLGVIDELAYGDDGYDVLLLARVDAGSAGPRITRLAMRSPTMPLRISGDVYWLGLAGADEGLAWQVREYRGATSRSVAELAVEAAALHDAAGVEAFLRATAGETGAGRSIRESAVEGLAYHPSDESLTFLRRVANDDPDLDLRIEAVETLGELDHPGAPGAVRELLRGGDPRVREEAVETVAQEVQDAGVIGTLVEVARNDVDADVRHAAVEAIGEQPPARAVPALRSLLSSPDRDVLTEVAETLGELGTPDALDVLDDILEGDFDEDVLHEAVEAIAEGFSVELSAPRLEAIGRDHPSVEVRREALDQLMDMRMSGPGGAELLLEIAMSGPDEDTRTGAVERMVDLPVDEAVRLLSRAAFESAEVGVRAEAAESLGEVGTPEALAALASIIESHASVDVAVEAVESIGDGFPRELAIAALERIVTGHPSAEVRREALDQLSDLGRDG